MPCFRPLTASLSSFKRNGKRLVSFGRYDECPWDASRIVSLPCGQCIGCRLERSRRWAVRLVHENQLHSRSCFLTLTYNNRYVPKDGSLNVVDVQRFLKRLRRKMPPLRFFQCGEYGEKFGRPHHHMILFGADFSGDRIEVEPSKSGDPQFESETLSRAWGKGRCVISEVTFESAAYVARYCVKKVTGRGADSYYSGRKPEFVTMSRRPGIGAGYAKQWLRDFYESDSIIMRGKEMMPPPFYDKLLEKVDPDLFKRVKSARAMEGEAGKWDPENCTSRFVVRERVAKAKLTPRGE